MSTFTQRHYIVIAELLARHQHDESAVVAACDNILALEESLVSLKLSDIAENYKDEFDAVRAVISQRSVVSVLVREFADMFASDNERFKRERFMRACEK